MLGAFHVGNKGSNPLGDVTDKRKGLEEILSPCSFPAKSVSHRVSNLRQLMRTALAQIYGRIGHMATRKLTLPESAIARRFKQDRSAVSLAVQRVDNDPELIRAATTLIDQSKRKGVQRGNNVPIRQLREVREVLADQFKLEFRQICDSVSWPDQTRKI